MLRADAALHCAHVRVCVRRYLLNLDGHTAAYRLGHLLATNSLVLKQESRQLEYYYRFALKCPPQTLASALAGLTLMLGLSATEDSADSFLVQYLCLQLPCACLQLPNMSANALQHLKLTVVALSPRRSLRAYHHYVPILKKSEDDLVPRIDWARQHETQARHIVSNANHFAMRYVTYPVRVVYWKYVLLAYRSLILDMDDYFKQSASTGSQMEVLLKNLAAKQATGPLAGSNATLGQALSDPAVQARLDAVAALAGEEAAVEEQQQLGVLLSGPGSGLEDALESLTGGDY